MNYFCNLLYFSKEVLNLGVELHEDGVNNVETHKSDIRLYLYVSKVHLLVWWLSNWNQLKRREYSMSKF